MNKILKKLLINQKGGTALLLTLLILFAVFTVTLTASDIVISGLKMSKERYDSTKAYFAAESAGELIIWKIRKDSYDIYTDCEDGASHTICFTDGTDTIANCANSCLAVESDTVTLSNNAFYSIQYDFSTPTTTLSCLGQYANVGRRVQLKY